MKRTEEFERDITEIEKETIDKLCGLLTSYNGGIRRYLANITAALCDVDVNEMLTDTTKMFNVNARWLYWYAYRYMTGETFEGISEHSRAKRYFATPTIAAGVSKMSTMINLEVVWLKRWTTLRRVVRIINQRRDEQQDAPSTEKVSVRVIAPKGVNIKIEQE